MAAYGKLRETESALRKRFGAAAAAFAVLFLAGYAAAALAGVAPPYRVLESEAAVVAEANRAERLEEAAAAQPRRIVIEAIGVDAPVVNPQIREIAALDAALRKGVVHYPGSGTPTDKSNMFLFGHSSNLPVVRNPAYQVFNNLGALAVGGIIEVYSDERAYRYRVRTVSLAEASEVRVTFETGEKKLTLSTCNNFGAKSERFVVEADFVGSAPREG